MARVLDAYMTVSRAVFIFPNPLVALCFVGCLFIKDQGLGPIDGTITQGASDESRDVEEAFPRDKSSEKGEASRQQQQPPNNHRLPDSANLSA